MKQIRDVLLYAAIAILFVGVLYVSVMGILRDAQRGELTILDAFCWTKIDKVQRKQVAEVKNKSDERLAKKQEQEIELSRQIDNILADMSLEQKLAQMMILTNEKDITKENLEKYQPGGVIFFGVDFKGKTVEQVRNRVDTLQSYVSVPLFVGVDEEGGKVSRVTGMLEDNLPVFESARNVYQSGLEQVKTDTKNKMQLLKAMGINLNFDPVADVVENENSYMYERSASGDAWEVAEYVETVLLAMQEEGVSGCIKHFPGYGENVNTHKTLARDDRSLEEYEQKDFIPFRTGINNGVDMVMVSHIVMEAVDSENPASLSLPVHEMLRNDFGFQGIILSDDLNMQAILADKTIEEATAQAFLAGNDMIFSADFNASMQGARKVVEQGGLSETQIDESVRRVLRMKIKNGLLVY